MSFYSDFAPYYEQVFPYREDVYGFLKGYAGEKGCSVLDAGCGPGHYCGRFFQDGYRVTGIDLDAMMIEAAEAAYQGAMFMCMDIALIGSLQGTFDLVYSIGNVLSHLPQNRLPGFLHDIHASLEKGGYWIAQVVNWDFLVTLDEYSFPVKHIGSGETSFYRAYSSISSSNVIFEVKLVSGGSTVFQESSGLYPVTSEQYVQLHENAGLSLKGIYAGYDKTSFRKDRNSGLVMIFSKR
ncbi:MAG: class I SAM-dependent methyltransferase [Chlorobiaceae bacterium]|nr:class I SAM-dependent methyltransferase [Chlorobiaceae bacterium]